MCGGGCERNPATRMRELGQKIRPVGREGEHSLLLHDIENLIYVFERGASVMMYDMLRVPSIPSPRGD